MRGIILALSLMFSSPRIPTAFQQEYISLDSFYEYYKVPKIGDRKG